MAIKKYLNYRQEFLKTFVLPTVAALIMGVGTYGFYELLFLLTTSTTFSLILAIIFAMFIYAIMLFLFNVVSEEELRMIPKGYKLVPIVKKLGLMK